MKSRLKKTTDDSLSVRIVSRPLLLLLSLVLCVAVQPAGADQRDDARLAERDGDYSRAIELYLRWLDGNLSHRNSPDVLLHAAALSDKAPEALDILKEYAPKLPASESVPVLVRMAALETLLGLPSDAVAHYERAAARQSGPEGHSLLYEALILRFGMGEYEYVSGQARSLAGRSSDGYLVSDLVALEGASLAMLGRAAEALDLIDMYISVESSIKGPLLWLTMADIAGMAGDGERLAEARSGLSSRHPEAVNNHLAAGRIRKWISPAQLSRDRNTEAGFKAIQVGSFSAREGAASLRHTLENDGFTSWIEPSGDYWRVYVNDPDGETAGRLDASGYDYSP